MNFELNNTYTFNTLAPAILGSIIKNATILGILDYTTASNYITPETMHVNIYPYLPVGVPSNPKKYTYILFRGESGNKIVLALQWIDISSITLVEFQTLKITIEETVSNDVEKIRETLLLNGFTKFSIDIL